MRLYYIGGSEGPRHYVRSALGVDAERWNEMFRDIHSWRLDLRSRYGIPLCLELHASDLLAGWGMHARNGETGEQLTRQQGAEILLSGLRRLEDAARSKGGIETINVCLDKAESRRYEQVSLDRLLNRINTSVASAGRQAFLIFGEEQEKLITRTYRRLRVHNPVPSRYETWEDGERTRNIPVEHIIGGPAFRSSDGDNLLQVADFMAHALLKKEEATVASVEKLGTGSAFSVLDRALNREASRRDPLGIVRR